ncbi:UbiA prenyltransferase family protein [Candidatus Microgenomates bacterium]|nr:UbiA prenyltransferase family protein [Candidatus Microgenomates bacterium]
MNSLNWRILFKALRPNQWIKNLILFAAIIFNGKIFDGPYLLHTLSGFFIFCALSSSSYLFNDIIDLKYDRLHPLKKKRPLASGDLPLNTAVEIAFLLALFALLSAILISTGFFLISFSFILLHILYSLVFKKYAILDILSIAFSFTLRAFAGEILTGFHLPFWLSLTIIFIAIFIAATKRHAELLREGSKTRPALFQYQERLLDFYTSMFGSASIIAYSLFTFLEEPPQFNTPVKDFLITVMPQAVDRKWMIVTIPFIIYILMRYAQLAYSGADAEQPEKIVTTDIPLIVSMFIWGVIIITILYVL